MAATSPYTGNDYQAVSNFRPYELPINDIFKSISAQNQFWDAGAARVKSYYDKGLNLDLTSEENVKIRDQFMKDAEKELIKLSSMDLADPSVQKKGMSIFKPLFKDRAILYDDHMTRTQKQIYADADRYKNDEKTKGAGFHMDNLAYALMPFRNFGKDTKRDELEGIYNKAKNASYIPHYDFSKERIDILENCKADRFSNTTEQGAYLETERDASLTKSKLWGCLDAAMSDQAKQQIRISAAVKYDRNYGVLKGEYLESATSQIEAYTEEVASLSAKKAAIKGNPQYAEQEKALTEQISMYEERIKEKKDDLSTIESWTDKDIENNYENLAFTAYFKRINEPFAQAFARADIERDKKANPIWMTRFVQQKLDDRQLLGFEHDKEMENLKFRLKMLYGGDDDGKTVSERMRAAVASGMISPEEFQKVYGSAVAEEGMGFDAINTLVGNANTELNTKFAEMKSYLETDPDLAKVMVEVKTIDDFNKKIPQINAFLSAAMKNPNSPAGQKARDMIEAMNRYVGVLNTKTHYQSILDDAQSQAYTPELKNKADAARKEFLSKMKSTVTLIDDSLSAGYAGRKPLIINLDKNRIYNIFSGTDAQYGVRNNKQHYYPYVEVYDKKTGQAIGSLSDEADKIHDYYLGLSGSIESERIKSVDNLLKQKLATQRQTIISGNLLDEKNFDPRVKEFVESVFGTLKGNVKFRTVGNFNPVTGEVEIQGITSKGEVLSYKELKNAAAEAKGDYGQSLFTEGSRGTSIRVKIPALQIIKKPQGIESIEALVDYGSNKVMENIKFARGFEISAGYTPKGNNVSLKIERGLGTDMPKYSIVVKGVDDIQVLPANSKTEAIDGVQRLLSGAKIK